jgi:hypothetical protein
MAVNYTWEVTGIKTTTVANTDNVVVQTYWKKIGKDGDYTGTFSGATPFSADSMPAGTAFIPFNQLKESDVLRWIQAVVVDNYAEHVDGIIQKQIDEAKNPVVDATLPWAPAPAANTANTP